MRQMRKANRQKDEQWALDVFDKAPYVTISMVRHSISIAPLRERRLTV